MTLFNDPKLINPGDKVFHEYDDKKAFGTVIIIEKELDNVCNENHKPKQGTSTCSHDLVITRISEFKTGKIIYSHINCQKCGKQIE